MEPSYTKFLAPVAPFCGLTRRTLSGHSASALAGMPSANMREEERDAQQDSSADNPGVVRIDLGLRRRDQRLERESGVNRDGSATAAATGRADNGDGARGDVRRS